MAEQVNQRIEGMINELEQMKRTELYNDEEIKEISRKRKEFEYRVQRRVKEKDDYVQYITYELALLEDISLRRKQAKLTDKKKDIEYAVAKRVNKVFKQFIYRFQNDIGIYFEYIKFCRSVGFDSAISGIIGQMLQIHGDKPRMWQLASKWEKEEQQNLDNARSFLLKGIQRHPDSEILYLDLFEIELTLIYRAEGDEEKEKQLKRCSVIWKNAVDTIKSNTFLFQLCELAIKYDVSASLIEDVKKVIWSRRDDKDVWSYIAFKELEGCHWNEIEEFMDEEYNFPKVINNYLAVFEEALLQFPDEKLCTKYIHNLLGVNEEVCSTLQKIKLVKHAWMYGHENGVLSNDMYAFGIAMLKLDDGISREDILEILDAALTKNPKSRSVWEEKLNLYKSDNKRTLEILQEASKRLPIADSVFLWNLVLDKIDCKEMINNFYKKFQNCENTIVMAIKPKLLKKMYEHSGLKAARDLYDEFIRTPPVQMEANNVMIDVEKSQEKPNAKNIRKCYEYAVQQHGQEDVNVWMEYMKFETDVGNAQAAPALYRRAIATLKKELVDAFIKSHTLAKLK